MEKLFWNDAIAIHWIFLFISISILPAITARNMSCNSLTDLLTVNMSLVTHRTVDVPIKLKCQMPMSMNCDCCILRCRLAYRMQFDVTKFRTSNGITNKTCWNDWLHFVSAPVSVNRNQLWHSRYHSLFLLLLCFTRKHTHTHFESINATRWVVLMLCCLAHFHLNGMRKGRFNARCPFYTMAVCVCRDSLRWCASGAV